MEVLYSEKGSRYDDYIVDVKQTLTYIDVPVLYHFVKETGNGFIIGPQVSVFLDSENEMLYQKGHAYIHMMEIHDNNAFRPIDIGIVGGFIFSIEDLIRIEGRMGLGLTNFVNNSVLDREEKLKGRIANVQLSVGLNY
ncbi:MAG: hypothetical protein C0594_08935 [Marinilabiliales bacterium]|nr:MAG: hypothetical protein C0594_08935 [Marinilabiliales bacterium]